MTKNLFIKFLRGNCTEEEFKQLLLWIKERALSSPEKGMVQEVWDEFEPDAESAEKLKYSRILDKIHHQINISLNTSHLMVQKRITKNRMLSIITRAAAILLIPVLSLLLYTNLSDKGHGTDNLNNLEVVAPAGSQVHMELCDGTKVWLNHGSKLKYPYHFRGKSRKVFLIGEAYFEVAHNKDIPFVVETNRLDVKATGTAFNVSAYPEDDVVETTLVEGKIILYKRNSNCEIKALSPNECLKFNSQKNVYTLESGNTEKSTAWKDGLLVFKNDSISEVAKKLARWYNVDVEITNEKVKEFTYTATFSEETLSQVLELMTLPTPVSYKLTVKEKKLDGSFSKQKVLIGLKFFN